MTIVKLHGLGPVDKKPSTNYLHHFVKKETYDTWHVTPGGGEGSHKMLAPQLLRFGIDSVLKILN